MGRINDIRVQAESMPDKYLECRTWQHRWGAQQAKALNNSIIRISAFCDRCEAEAWREITIRGSIVGRGLFYPDGYLMHDTGVLSTRDRDLVRAEYIGRLLDRPNGKRRVGGAD